MGGGGGGTDIWFLGNGAAAVHVIVSRGVHGGERPPDAAVFEQPDYPSVTGPTWQPADLFPPEPTAALTGTG